MTYPLFFEYTLTKADFDNAQRLYRNHRRIGPFSITLWSRLITAICAAIVVTVLILGLTHHDEVVEQFQPLAWSAFFFALMLPFARWRAARKSWKSSLPPGITGQIPVSLHLTHDQIISAVPGRSEGRFFWTAIIEFAQDDRIALLFIRKKVFLYIPRNILPDQAWTRLQSSLAHLPQP